MKKLANFTFFILILFSCKEEESQRDFPAVNTSDIVIVEDDGVFVQGSIENWSAEIIDHGFVFYTEGSNEDNYNRVSLANTTNSLVNDFETKIVRNLKIGERYNFKAFAETNNYIVYGEEQEFVSLGGKAPELTNFSPQNAWANDTITIRGKYFANNNSENVIGFNNTKTSPIVSNDTLLKVLVPSNLNTVTNKIRVEVAGKSSAFDSNFRIAEPIIKNFIPEEVLPKEVLTIKGQGVTSITKLLIDGNEIPSHSVSDTSVSFSLSGHSISEGQKRLRFYMLDKLIEGNQYYKVVWPKITSISPQFAWIDTVLTVKGQYLAGVTSFTISDLALQEISKNDTMVELRIPGAFYSSPITAQYVYPYDVESNSNVKLQLPEIKSIEPAIAHAGESITIKGERFFYGLSSQTGSFTYISKNEASLRLPSSIPAGKNNIILQYGNDTYISSLTFSVPEIEIVDYYPKEIRRGDTITVIAKGIPDHLVGYNVLAFDFKPTGIIERNGNVLKTIVPNNIDISTSPSLSLFIAGQEATIPNAFTFINNWPQLEHKNSVTSVNYVYVERNGINYLLSQNQQRYTLQKFDASSEQWIQISTTKLQDYTQLINAFSTDNALYFITNNNGKNYNYRYSISSEEWSQVADLPDAEIYASYSYTFKLNSQTYVGGINGLWAYDEANDSWISNSKLPTNHYELNNPLYFNNENYGFVGFKTSIVNGIEYNEFWKYDASGDRWEHLGNAPLEVSKGGTTVVFNNSAYIVTNSFQIGIGKYTQRKMIKMDLSNNKVSSLTPPPGLWSSVYYHLFKQDDNLYFMYKDDPYSGWTGCKLAISDLDKLSK